jgi:hypothetical protein
VIIQSLLNLRCGPQFRGLQLKRHGETGVRAVGNEHHDHLSTRVLNALSTSMEVLISDINSLVKADPVIHHVLTSPRGSAVKVFHREA